jgi:hypothetical protein
VAFNSPVFDTFRCTAGGKTFGSSLQLVVHIHSNSCAVVLRHCGT